MIRARAGAMLRFPALISFNGALDPGPRPLELTIEIPRGPVADRRSTDRERPARPSSSRTVIEIDLVDDEPMGREDDDDALHSHVIEIDLA